MSLKFDATLKGTVKEDPAGYAVRFGLPPGKPVSLLDVDLSTLTAATDAAIGVGDPLEEIADLNFQSGPDPRLPDRVLLYNSALHFRYGVPIRSIVVLMRTKADHANLTGILAYGDGKHRLEFHYDVVRIWEQPAESFRDPGRLGLLPLAVLEGKLPAHRSIEDAAQEGNSTDRDALAGRIASRASGCSDAVTAILASIRIQEERPVTRFSRSWSHG